MTEHEQHVERARCAVEVLAEAGGGLRTLFQSPAMDTGAGRASKSACQELCRVAVREGVAGMEGGAWRILTPEVEEWSASAVGGLSLAMANVARATPQPVRKLWRQVGLDNAADAVSRVEGLAKVSARAQERDVGRAGRLMDMKATMYFAYGQDKRPDVKSSSTFDAILRGERTSTTRFDVWPGAEQWAQLEPGALVRFYEDKDKSGRFVDVAVSSLRRVDMARFNDAQMEEWSRVEGWSVAHGRKIGQRGMATQVRYQPLEGEVERLVSQPRRSQSAQER